MVGTSHESRGGIATVIRTYREFGLFDRYPILFLTSHYSHSFPKTLCVWFWSLLRFIVYCMTLQVRTLHVHSASRGSFWRKSTFLTIAIAFRVPTIFHLHGGEFDVFVNNECNRLQKAVVYFFLHKCSKLIVISSQWHVTVKSLTSNPNIITIPNPILIPVSAEPNTACRCNNRLLFVGKICANKGIYDLLKAVHFLCVKFPDLELLVAGEGEPDKLDNAIEALGLHNNVKKIGWVQGSEKERVFRESTIFVMPSYMETFGMANVEAMSHGLPVVSTNVGGIPDVIENLKEGILVDPGDIDGLCRAISELLANKTARDALGIAGLQKVKENFSCDKVIPMLIHLYYA